jgi:DUF4097 and DUF4098 domain-containing protein YvlB
MKQILLSALMLIFSGLTSAIDLGINSSIRITDGEKRSDGCATVNGSITIGSDCIVGGSCSTVNGQITVGNNTKAYQLQTVNGGIEIGTDVEVKDDVQTVNGNIRIDKNGKIYGDVSTVNGDIDLISTVVEHGISTHNGDINLVEGSVVKEDIIIKESHGNSDRHKPLEITISDKSVVQGDILVQEDDIEVIVYLEKGGKVLGKVDGAKVIEQ